MRGRRTLTRILFVAIGLLLVAGRASAESCRVEANSLAFGQYDVFRSSPTDSATSLSFECSNCGRPISIELERNWWEIYRVLQSGSQWMYYNIYLDASRTQVWGDGSLGSQVYYNSNPPKKKEVTVPMYGRIPASQDVGLGQYADNITVVVNF
jgi:spore coat protein U-like protein